MIDIKKLSIVKSEKRKLFLLNQLVNNSFSYTREEKHKDNWKTPTEFVNDGGGDCEDFAIYKYQCCKELDFKDEDMFFAHLSLEFDNHIVLVVRVDENKYVLDNIQDAIYDFESLSNVNFTFDLHHIYRNNKKSANNISAFEKIKIFLGA